MHVSELMSRNVVTIGPSDSCREAVSRMHGARVRHLPVVSAEGGLIGVVTDRDLRHHLFAPRVLKDVGTVAVDIILKAVPVSDVMTSPVMSVPAKADIVEAARIMLEDKVGSLPVVEGGKVVGIITETDVLRQICKADAACSEESPNRRLLPVRGGRLLLAAYEHDVGHAGLDASLADLGEAREKIEHARVVGEHVGAEAVKAPRLGGVEQVPQEGGAEAQSLKAVLYDERDLDRIGIVGGLVAADADQLRGPGWAALGHEREPSPVVHGGQHPRPVRRQALHDAEEALVRAVTAQPVEVDQPRRVFGTYGAQTQGGAVPESDVPLELARIVRLPHGI
jgi:CBS domain-containing protein